MLWSALHGMPLSGAGVKDMKRPPRGVCFVDQEIPIPGGGRTGVILRIVLGWFCVLVLIGAGSRAVERGVGPGGHDLIGA